MRSWNGMKSPSRWTYMWDQNGHSIPPSIESWRSRRWRRFRHSVNTPWFGEREWVLTYTRPSPRSTHKLIRFLRLIWRGQKKVTGSVARITSTKTFQPAEYKHWATSWCTDTMDVRELTWEKNGIVTLDFGIPTVRWHVCSPQRSWGITLNECDYTP